MIPVESRSQCSPAPVSGQAGGRGGPGPSDTGPVVSQVKPLAFCHSLTLTFQAA